MTDQDETRDALEPNKIRVPEEILGFANADQVSEVAPEDLLRSGKASHDEPAYKVDEVYLVGRPDPVWRYPIFDCEFHSPMQLDIAIQALDVVLQGEVLQLPSLRSRLYRVNIEEYDL